MRYELQVPSDPNFLAEIEEFAERSGLDAGLEQHRASMLGLILTEAANNSIHHGNQGKPELPVYLTIESFDDYLRVEVKDSGAGFDPTTIPDPTAPENLLSEHGRGFLILRHYCREVHTQIVPDGFVTIMLFNREE